MRSLPAVVAAAVGAAVATLCLVGPTTFVITSAFVAGPASWTEVFDGPVAKAVVGALVALVAAVGLRTSAAALAGALVGAVALPILVATGTPGQGPGYLTGIAAGLLLGGLSVMTRPRSDVGGRGPRLGLGAGVVAGFLLAQSLPISFGRSENRRYADYVPSTLHFSLNWVAVTIGSVVTLVALAVFAVRSRSTLSDAVERPERIVVAVGVVVPVATFLISWWAFASVDGIHVPNWFFGAVVTALALVAALVSPGRTGLVWVGVVAIVSTYSSVGDSGDGWVITLVIAVLVVLGGVVAQRYVGLLIALAVLVVVVLVQLLGSGSAEPIVLVAAILIAPAAVAYVLAVCASGSPDESVAAHPASIAVALTAPVSLSLLQGGSDVGWTAYTPLTDVGSGFVDIGSTTATTVTASVIGLVAAGVVAFVISRRATPGTESQHS